MRTLLPGDNPQAYIPGDRRRALARAEELPLRAHGAAMFVDISGFTPLTEALARELGGRRGAEELSATLDRIFAALLEPLHLWQGSVIYFSGDAVTAWIDGDDGVRATACALAMQEVMARVGVVSTPGGVPVTLGVKVAVAVGGVRRFVVGTPDVQLIDVLAGRLMDSLAAAEGQSAAGEVVLDPGAVASLGDRVVIRETREGVGVVEALVDHPAPPEALQTWPDLPDDVARQWLLPPVWERMVAGRGELLADLRPAVPVFVRFGGLDFEGDPEAPSVLDDFVTRAQRALDEQGGSVLQLTIGDKGAYLYGVFGSPLAHEDDAARACEASLRLLEIADDVPVTDVQVGVAAGRLRSGTYGHHQRRTFCCLGDAVNLAARLMTRAPVGGIWVHGDVAASTGDRFEWEELPPIQVKGREQQVAVRALRGRSARRTPARAGALNAIVGRDEELGQLRDLWRRAETGRGQVVVVQAEAGTGKSRLVGELVLELVAQGVPVPTGEATPLATQVAYAGWRGIWTDLLGLEDEEDEEVDEARVTGAVRRLGPGLVGRAPLLGPVLGVALPDSDLTASFDGELRKGSLEDLLRQLLTARAALGGFALVIEDAHWLDPLSRDLLEVLGRAVAGLPVMVMVTTRPDGTALAGLPLGRGDHVTDLVLDTLGVEASTALVAERHRALVGSEAAPEMVATVVERAEGNAFYLEQLVDYVLAHAARADGSLDPDALELPSSLHSLVLSRIDAQPEGPRRAVKVASVIGRTFRSPLVAAAYPDLGTDAVVHDDLVTVAATRLIELESPEERAFAFGHAVTRDVAYDSLPFSIRTVLHGRVGDALESEPDGPRRHLDLLAFHYSRSDDVSKQRHYLLAAAAAARASYANESAIAYLEQALPLVGADERNGVLLQLAEALEIGGDWAAAEDAVARAAQAAAAVGDSTGVARARTARAELARKQGRYAEAEEELTAAEEAFLQLGDLAGRGRVLHLRGTLASQQGHPDEARLAYEASLALREEIGDEAGVAAMLTNLALVAEDEGDLAEAERLSQEGLARRRALDDRRAVSVCLMNMGMLATTRGELDDARQRFAEAQALASEVGDPWLDAVGRHNLGNVTRDLGDLAASPAQFDAALDAYVERDDRWSLAHLFEDIALWMLAADADSDADSVALLAAAEVLREEIGAPRFPPTEAVLVDALAPARDRTAADLLERADAAGRRATLGATIDAVRRVLASAGASSLA